MLLGVGGFAGVGKDTFADILVENHGFEKRSFAALLRKLAWEINPVVFYWNPQDVRRFSECAAQDLDECLRLTELCANFFDIPSSDAWVFLEAANPIIYAESGGARYRTAINFYGYTEAKIELPEMREFLQRLGTEAGRNVIGENVWVDMAMSGLDPEQNYVFPDMRFPNEAAAMDLRILLTDSATKKVNAHVSEQFAEHPENFDAVVWNTPRDLKTLTSSAKFVVDSLAK